MTPAEIKQNYTGGHFFDKDTMSFFGDTMKSFGSRIIDGKQILYRKPSAMVNVFGTWKRTGRDFFGCWEFVDGDLNRCDDETKEKVFEIVS